MDKPVIVGMYTDDEMISMYVAVRYFREDCRLQKREILSSTTFSADDLEEVEAIKRMMANLDSIMRKMKGNFLKTGLDIEKLIN